MPLYEYSCSACCTVSEINHRLADPAPVDCPVCGAPKLAKQISAAGFRLKGAGWYETDFKSGDNKKNLVGDGGAGGDAKPDAKPAGDGKADTKPGVKPDTKSEPKKEAKPEAKPAAKPAAPSSGSGAST